jgi:PAS domain S-box-containing protein
MLGYDEEEIIGKNTHNLIHHHDPEGSVVTHEKCIIHTAASSQEQQSRTDWLIRKNGEYFPVKIIATPILQNGVYQGSVIAFSDISTEYVAEQKLKKLHQDLFELIAYNADA